MIIDDANCMCFKSCFVLSMLVCIVNEPSESYPHVEEPTLRFSFRAEQCGNMHVEVGENLSSCFTLCNERSILES